MLKSHLTAIGRKKPSAPMRFLMPKLKGSILDFGCGRGFDCKFYNIDGYDPYYRPNNLAKKYDYITCNFVLNVIEKEEADDVLKTINFLLKDNGTAFITVRRDKYKEGLTSIGTFQRHVFLNLPIEHEQQGRFCIYRMSKDILP